MIDKVCEHCGRPFKAKRATAKYDRRACSVAATRLRAQLREDAQPPPRQAPASPGVVVEPTAVWGAGEQPPNTAWGEDEPITVPAITVLSTTTADLTAAKVLETPNGQAALVLAARMDASHHESGASLASLAKQLDLSVTRAKALTAKAPENPLEKLRRERQERRGA